jgi:hypothetical protein
MPRVKPLPPALAWELATLRPHLDLMAARVRAFTDAADRLTAAIADVQRLLDESRR